MKQMTLFVCLFGLILNSVQAQSIQLDQQFGDGGIFDLPGDPDGFVDQSDLVVRPDGSFILLETTSLGSGFDLELFARAFTADQSPYEAVWDAGVLSFGLEGYDLVGGGAIWSEDDLVTISGVKQSGNSQWVITARFLPDGTLDPDFGLGGITEIPVPGGLIPDDFQQDPAGNLWISGFSTAPDLSQIYIIKLDPTGQPDSSFGQSGLLTLEVGTDFLTRVLFINPSNNAPVDLSVQRIQAEPPLLTPYIFQILPDGSLNPDFGNNGIRQIYSDLGYENAQITNLVPAEDGGWFTGLLSETTVDEFTPYLAKLTADFLPDPNFGNGGLVELAGIPTNGDYFQLGLSTQDDLLALAGLIREEENQISVHLFDQNGEAQLSNGSDGLITFPVALDLLIPVCYPVNADGAMYLTDYPPGSTNENSAIVKLIGENITQTGSINAPEWTISISPNPASEYLQIAFDRPPDTTIRWRLRSVAGKDVHQLSAMGVNPAASHVTELVIPADIPSGMYILSGYTHKHVFSRKVLIQ